MLAPSKRKFVRVVGSSTEKHVMHFRSSGAHRHGHVVGVQVSAGHYTVFDNDARQCVDSLADVQQGRYCAWFRLLRALSQDEQRSMEANRTVALQRRSARLVEQSAQHARLESPAAIAEHLAHTRVGQDATEATNRTGLVRPPLPVGWVCPQAPPAPVDFATLDVALPEIRWLSTLNEHPRDRNLVRTGHAHLLCEQGADVGISDWVNSCLLQSICC